LKQFLLFPDKNLAGKWPSDCGMTLPQKSKWEVEEEGPKKIKHAKVVKATGGSLVTIVVFGPIFLLFALLKKNEVALLFFLKGLCPYSIFEIRKSGSLKFEEFLGSLNQRF